MREPAPQRDPERRPGRGRGRRNAKRQDPPQKGTPLSEWLSSAKHADLVCQPTPASPTADAPEIRSPSWADEEPDEPDEQFSDYTSDMSTPPPLNEAYDIPPVAEKVKAAAAECVDIYALPPSGKVTKRQPLPTRAADDKSDNRAHGGARPKTLGKTNEKSNGNTSGRKKGGPTGRNDAPKKQNCKPESSRKESYAKVASENAWKTMGKKRKFDKVSPKGTRPLKGIAATVNREIYLQGLDLDGCVDEEDIIESVREYCADRGVKLVYIRVIPVKYDDNRAGCKITVVEDDFERVVDSDFWPDNISSREWTRRPRDDRANDGGAARQPSDDDEV